MEANNMCLSCTSNVRSLDSELLLPCLNKQYCSVYLMNNYGFEEGHVVICYSLLSVYIVKSNSILGL
jgi:hypothetical protein